MMTKYKLKGCIQSDFYRVFHSKKCLIGLGMVVLVLLMSSFETISWKQDTLYVFDLVMYGMPVKLTLIGGAFCFADSICNDMEHNYILSIISRSGLKNYVRSKVLLVFTTAFFCVAIGTVIYTCILHVFLPWGISSGNIYQQLIRNGNFKFFLKHRFYIGFYFASGLESGALAGITALTATYLSLFIRNKMLILATPFVCVYFFDYILQEFSKSKVSLNLIFMSYNNIFHNDMLSTLLVVIISVGCVLLLGKRIEKKLWREFFVE